MNLTIGTANQASLASLASQSGSAGSAQTATAPQPKLVAAAHEFEGQMMKELLKPLMSSGSLTGEDDDADDGSGGALGEFASEALARSLSDGGGFGIANEIIKDLSHSSNQGSSGKVTKKVHDNTEMRALK